MSLLQELVSLVGGANCLAFCCYSGCPSNTVDSNGSLVSWWGLMYWSILVSIWTALITGSSLCSQISESTCPVFVPISFPGEGGSFFLHQGRLPHLVLGDRDGFFSHSALTFQVGVTHMNLTPFCIRSDLGQVPSLPLIGIWVLMLLRP